MPTQAKNRLSQADKLAVIQARKRRGDMTRISEQTGFAVSTVSYVLSGRFANEAIVNAAYKRVARRKE